MEVTENRYSGIPIIYDEMKKANLLPPKFEDDRFQVDPLINDHTIHLD